MSWQPGDKVVRVGAREVRMRLTLGALSEICARLGADTLTDLTAHLRKGERATLDIITLCLLRPIHGEAAQGLALALPPERSANVIAEMFEEAFL